MLIFAIWAVDMERTGSEGGLSGPEAKPRLAQGGNDPTLAFPKTGPGRRELRPL
jgi:hypothetical protein